MKPCLYFIVLLIFKGNAFGSPKTITTFIYEFVHNAPDNDRPQYWRKGKYYQKISLLSDGSFFIELKRDVFYLGYQPTSKKYFFIDLKKRKKKEVVVARDDSYKVENMERKKCGMLYKLRRNRYKRITVFVCVRPVRISKKFVPLTTLLLPESINVSLEKSRVYLPTRFIARLDSTVIDSRSLLGKNSKERFPYDPEVLFKYKTLTGKCAEMSCGRYREIIKERTKQYKRKSKA